MLKPYVLACAVVGILAPTVALAYGEPRIVPDYPFYFDNNVLNRYPTATVVKVLSGNQVVVHVKGEQQLRVIQLAGVRNVGDYAPEIEQQAIAAIKDSMLHQEIRLEGDNFQRTPAGTGTVQAYLWLNGIQMNEELIRSGLATVEGYSFNNRRDNYLRGVQDEAILNRVGVWSSQPDGRTEAEVLDIPD